jgi:membrane protease YdiL (CAAX protease family)
LDRQWDARRTAIFLVFAFAIAWGIDLAIYLTGGLASGSPVLSASSGLVLAAVLLPASMFGPAIAHLLTRLVTREGWQDLYLSPRFRRAWPFWAVAWLGTPLLVLLGGAVFFLIFPAYFDPALTIARQILDQAAQASGSPAPVGPQLFILIQIVQAIVFAPLVNGWATLGEEFGWRAYLLPKLMPLGGRKAMVLLGLIWGVWHWPVIFMGYEYGSSYPGAPWLGPLVFLWFTFTLGTFLAWLTLKSGSVWPAVIGHASINGIATIGLYVSRGQPNPILGPAAVGVLASLPFAALALWLLWRSDVLSPRESAPEQAAAAQEPSRGLTA